MGRIVVPFDGGRAATHMLTMACETAVDRHDAVEAVYVLRIPPQLPIGADVAAARVMADVIVARAYDVAERVPVVFTAVLVEARHVGPGVVAAAEGADLLMMGLPARRRLFRRALFTPTLRYILAHAPCEVLVGYVPPVASAALASRFLRAGRGRTLSDPRVPDNVRVLRTSRGDTPHAAPYAERSSPAGGARRG